MDMCDKCNNSGRTNNSSVIEYCDCSYGLTLKNPNYRILYDKSHLPLNLTDATLEDFLVDKDYQTGEALPEDQVKKKLLAKLVVKEYKDHIVNALRQRNIILPRTLNPDGTSNMDNQYVGNKLFLCGGTNSGKTMLAINILKEAIHKTENSTAAFYTTWDDLLTELIPFDGDWRLLIAKCQKCGVLCLDSVTNLTTSPDQYNHVKTRLSSIISHRVLNNKPTILMSHYSPAMFDKGESIFKILLNQSLILELDKFAVLK